MHPLRLVLFSTLLYSSCFGNYKQNVTERFTVKIIAIFDSNAFRKTAIALFVVDMALLVGITTTEVYKYVKKCRKINTEKNYVCSHTKL